MRKFLNVCVLFIMFMSLAVFAQAGGEPHHPNWKRYGYIPLPLTDFKLPNGETIDESPGEGSSTKEGQVAMGINNNKPVLLFGNGTPEKARMVYQTFTIPSDYWRDGKIIAKAKNNFASANIYLKWTVSVSTDSTQDNTPIRGAAVTATAGATEALEFDIDGSDAGDSPKEGRYITFGVGVDSAPTFASEIAADGTTGAKSIGMYDFYYQYEKKTDS